jgi:hypothetical protein
MLNFLFEGLDVGGGRTTPRQNGVAGHPCLLIFFFFFKDLNFKIKFKKINILIKIKRCV